MTECFVDPELGDAGFTYRLADRSEGSVLAEQVLEYNRDPRWLRDHHLYELTVAAIDALERSPLARREIIRRLDTSPSQFYRLIDPTNYGKTIDQMILLLGVLGCETTITVRRD